MFKPAQQIGVGNLRISEREKQYVMQALDANRLSAGPFVGRFEAEMARLHGARFGVMSNSGTSSLQVALAAMKEKFGWQDGDEVLVPAVTFVATSNIVLYNQLKPVFVDVDARTYNIDPEQIERHITRRTRAIIPVHLFGLPCDMDPILEIAKRRGLRIMEDSCETMFVRYHGRPVGSFGDAACFSTYVAHILTTGIGGVGVTSDPELARLMKSIVNHGRDSIYLTIDDDKVSDAKKLFRIANSRFSFVRLGHSFRATEMEAALGVAQLERKDETMALRRRNAEKLTAGLRKLEPAIQLPSAPEGSEHAFMMYPIVLKDSSLERAGVISYLEQNLVETRYMLPLLNQPIYRQLFGDLEPEYPVAREINNRGFYIGSHPGLTDEEIQYTVDTISDAVSGKAAAAKA